LPSGSPPPHARDAVRRYEGAPKQR